MNSGASVPNRDEFSRVETALADCGHKVTISGTLPTEDALAKRVSCDDFDDYDDCDIGCVNCWSGWVHGCCDDLCINSNEAAYCENARACRVCNPYGEVA